MRRFPEKPTLQAVDLAFLQAWSWSWTLNTIGYDRVGLGFDPHCGIEFIACGLPNPKPLARKARSLREFAPAP